MANQKIDIDDLLSDPNFLDWLDETDENLDADWKNWLEKNSDRWGDVQRAKFFIQSLYFTPIQISSSQSQQRKSKLFQKMK